MDNQCEVKHCKNQSSLLYYGYEVCNKHWIQHCLGKINLKKQFGIEEEDEGEINGIWKKEERSEERSERRSTTE